MRRISVGMFGVVLVSLAMGVAPVRAQTLQQRDWCLKGGTDDQVIQGCSAVLQSAQTSTADRASASTICGLSRNASS